MKLSRNVANASVCAFLYPIIWLLLGAAAEAMGHRVKYSNWELIVSTAAGWTVAYMASKISEKRTEEMR